MTVTAKSLGGRGRFARGVHPPDFKEFAHDAAIEVLPTPQAVLIPLLQHAGAPAAPVVKSRDAVQLGDVLATSEAFISAPVHASLSGTVGRASVATLPNGRHVAALPLTAGEQSLEGPALLDDLFGGDWSLEAALAGEPGAITAAVRAAGIVGQGGAAFPTAVKLARNEKKPIDTILVNGCECEPFLTADERLMIEFPAPVVAGARLAAQAVGAAQVVFAIEDNKPAAAAALERAAVGTNARIVLLPTRYPMGGEKQTVLAALGRTIPTGGLPLDVGVVVLNVATGAAIARAVLRGRPLTHRVVSVTGAGIVRPANVLAPVGLSYGELIAHCGGLKPEAARVIAGGPMMGFTLNQLDTPVTKGTSGITVLTQADLRQVDETACLRCGRCGDVCPLNLAPSRLALAARHQDWELARRHHLAACMECGCCAYVCPARIPLVQLIRTGKAQMPRN